MSNNINEKTDLSAKEFEARHEILDTEKTGYDKSGTSLEAAGRSLCYLA